MAIVSGVGDLDDECLATTFGPRAHLIDDVRTGVFVDLVDQRHMHPRFPSRPRASEETGLKKELVRRIAILFTVFSTRRRRDGDASIIFSASANTIFAWS